MNAQQSKNVFDLRKIKKLIAEKYPDSLLAGVLLREADVMYADEFLAKVATFQTLADLESHKR